MAWSFVQRSRRPPLTGERRAWRGARWLKALFIACVGLEVLYVGAAGAFLNTSLFAKLFETTNTVNATFRYAWSVWPGSVHIRDLRIVFQDPNLQWSLDLPTVHARLSLAKLAQRTLRATSVTGEGGAFRMRHRLQPEAANEPWVAALPPIPEFTDPPLFESGPPTPPISDEEYNLWTVHLEGVDVGIAEVWAQFVRYQGEGRASGAFALRPARRLWVGPASLTLAPGKLSVGQHPLAQSVQGKITCTVHPFDVRAPSGREVFRYISTRMQLQAAGVQVAAAPLIVPESAELALAAAPGSLHVDLEVARGHFTETSRVEYRSDALSFRTKALDVSANALHVIARAVGEQETEAVFSVGKVSLQGTASKAAPLLVRDAHAAFKGSSRDTTANWSLVESRFELGAAELADAAWLNAFLEPLGVVLRGGKLAASGSGRYAGDRLDGVARASFEKVRGRSGPTNGNLSGEIELEASGVRWNERSGRVTARLRGDVAEITRGEETISARGLRFTASGEALAAAAKGTLSGSIAAVTAGTKTSSLRGATQIDVTLDELDMDALTGRAHGVISLQGLRARPNGLQGLLVRAADAKIRGDWSRARQSASSHLKLTGSVPRLVAQQRDLTLNAALDWTGQFLMGHERDGPARLDLRAELRDAELVQSRGARSDRVLARAEGFDLTTDLLRDARGAFSGNLESRARGLVARLGTTWVRGNPTLSVALDELNPGRSTGELRADLVVRSFMADDREAGSQCPWSSIERADVRADVALQPNRTATGTVRGKLQRGTLVWGDFRATGQLDLLAQLQDVVLREGTGRIKLSGSATELLLRSGAGITSGWEAKVPALTWRGDLTSGDQVTGRVHLEVDQAHARIGRTRLDTDLSGDFRITQLDLLEQRGRFSGDVALENTRVRSGDESVDDWWAKIRLDSAEVRTGDNLDVAALFTAELRDALPGLAVLSAEDEVPGWLASALPLRKLQATGMINRRCRLTDIQFTDASGGPLASNGRLQSRSEGAQGAFLVRLSDFEAISAGIRFGAADPHVQLLAGGDWLSKQYTVLDRTARDVIETSCQPLPRTCGPEVK